MEKDVIISIKGQQVYPNSAPEVIELVTAGKLSKSEDNSITLSYQESEVTGLEGTLTTIQVEPERITLMRVGAVNSQMVFEEGRKHLSLYDTPYGALSVGINTRKMRAQLDETGGDITVHYAIEIEHNQAGRSVFHINVKEAAPWVGHGERKEI